MKPEVILHIGMHKTGTTSIQSTLNNFDDGKVRYAQLSDVNHSIPIFTLFSKNRYTYLPHNKFGRSEEEIDEINKNTVIDLERELNMDREKIIISGEDISFLEADEVQAMGTWFAERAKSVKVMAYVRDPEGFASSALQQYINGGLHKTFMPPPDYKKRFEAYTLCSEFDEIEFIQFKKTELLDGSVVADFCSRVGLASTNLTEQRTNESLSLECVQLLYHLNRFGMQTSGSPDLVHTRRHFSHFLAKKFKGDSFKVPKDYVWANTNMGDITWMENVSGIKLIPTDLQAQDTNEPSTDLLESTMDKVDILTRSKLQSVVAEFDEAIAKDTNVTHLLNFLFTTYYYKLKADDKAKLVAQQNAEAAAKLKAEVEAKLAAEANVQLAEQKAILAAEENEKLMAQAKAEASAKLQVEVEAKVAAEGKTLLASQQNDTLAAENESLAAENANLIRKNGKLITELQRGPIDRFFNRKPTRQLLENEQYLN